MHFIILEVTYNIWRLFCDQMFVQIPAQLYIKASNFNFLDFSLRCFLQIIIIILDQNHELRAKL